MSTKELRIATRRSSLAMWQAEHVRDRLQNAHPELQVSLVPMATQGDRILDVALAKIGGKGLFVKELESALLEGRADLAVHSMKDVPMDLPEGLTLATILDREDPSDAFVSNASADFAKLPDRARVGTSSLRRQCQLRALRPDLEISDLRGNVNTRLAKLDNGDFDAIILASAGLKRLGLSARISQRLTPEQLLPAVGQGAIGIEICAGDARTCELVEALHDTATATCIDAERSMNRCLQGGCQVPIAAHAVLQGDNSIWIRGLVGSIDGQRILRAQATGVPEQAAALGREIAEQLLAKGADALLAPLRGSS